MNPEYPIRINRYLSEAGFCSRRAADELVAQGRVLINGEPAVTGSKVEAEDRVSVDGQQVSLIERHRVYAFYKPIGYISSLSDEQGKGISEFITGLGRVYPVGRLDKDSEGLMLLTDDGGLMNEILKASGGHEKEYQVEVNRNITAEFLTGMRDGVWITNRADGRKVKTAPCKIGKLDDRTFRITLIQGLNRQIRRMCGCFSYQVKNLKRIRIMNIRLDGMKAGEIRELSNAELEELRRLCKRIDECE